MRAWPNLFTHSVVIINYGKGSNMLQYVTRKLECQSIEDSEDDDETRNIKVSVNV